MRVNVTLAYECGAENDITTSKQKNNPERVQMKVSVHAKTNKLYTAKNKIIN